MVFHLDYDKRSDLDDTVGYWYVEPTGRASCRVFYSCECQLRGWVPPPVYNVLTKEALKKATTWVSVESVKEWKAQQARNQFGPAQLIADVRASLESTLEGGVLLSGQRRVRGTLQIDNLPLRPPSRPWVYLQGSCCGSGMRSITLRVGR